MLNENLTIIRPTLVDDGAPRFSNPPPFQPSYQNYTMIEDVMSCQTALPYGTDISTSMPAYNSNGIIPAYHQAVCPSSAQQGFTNLLQHPPTPNMYIPQQYQTGVNFQQTVNQWNAANPQYQSTFYYPPFAGSVPEMKNARASDRTIPMMEGFALPDTTTNTNTNNTSDTAKCVECTKHIESCNLCQKINRCQGVRHKYLTIIIVLIIIIVLMACFIIMNRNKAPIIPKLM